MKVMDDRIDGLTAALSQRIIKGSGRAFSNRAGSSLVRTDSKKTQLHAAAQDPLRFLCVAFCRLFMLTLHLRLHVFEARFARPPVVCAA